MADRDARTFVLEREHGVQAPPARYNVSVYRGDLPLSPRNKLLIKVSSEAHVSGLAAYMRVEDLVEKVMQQAGPYQESDTLTTLSTPVIRDGVGSFPLANQEIIEFYNKYRECSRRLPALAKTG